MSKVVTEEWHDEQTRSMLRKMGGRELDRGKSHEQLVTDLGEGEVLVGHFTYGLFQHAKDITTDDERAKAWKSVDDGSVACAGVWAVPREAFYR